MKRYQLISGVMCCVFLFLSAGTVTAQGLDLKPSGTTSPTANNLTIIIVAEPKSSRPFNWQARQKVAIGVRCVSDDGVRVIGVGADIEFVAVKVFENRVQMALRSTPEMFEKLRTAAEISEYWFEVMPFHEGHRQALNSEVDVSEFLKNHNDYRPAGPDDWGYGAPDGRLEPPTGDELPAREWTKK